MWYDTFSPETKGQESSRPSTMINTHIVQILYTCSYLFKPPGNKIHACISLKDSYVIKMPNTDLLSI